MTKPIFQGSLEAIVVGAEERISFDLVDRLPEDAVPVSAEASILSGQQCVTIDRFTVSDTEVRYWIKGNAAGLARFVVRTTLSDGTKDGITVSLRIR